ncbi:putative lipase transmembrane protein [Hydrogenophaga taeniospiralis CCUG 15921]|uniref:Lipase transmembrane protein n=1 Tax=Hydrogenophaga taeniospiralis CCUG 15921 TaxID=1281780 RepID=A0A9X4NPT1_9BURK|nr:alpha/beta fold hydrolase [Hydrogenophaga taeniospiralis]MDG5975443.1 putative lipase transmembrane protein [Hydrogenophaga taeniospiralis CCUG 15921]
MQQTIALSTVALVAGWGGFTWERSPFLALAGAAVLVFGYAIVLAVEFLAVARVNRGDPSPRASVAELVGAWWQEVRVAPQVFSWRQPFRWRSLPDDESAQAGGNTGPAVVFIHGFVCNRGLWLPWMRQLRAQGVPYTSVNLEPVFGSIDDYVPLIDNAVHRAQALTGHPPLLVCHSMGGLAARAWLAATPDAKGRVHRVVTIGSPHAGTWLAQFSRVTNGRQMRQNNGWLRGLQQRETQSTPQATHAHFTCWYSNTDNIVFPASTATLPGADNRLVRGAAHVAMAFHPEVMRGSLALRTSPANAPGEPAGS